MKTIVTYFFQDFLSKRFFKRSFSSFLLQHFLSLKALIVFGFVVAVIPLFIGVIYAAISVKETSALGRTMNVEVFNQTKTVRLVLQKASDIERKARLFVLFSDPELRQPYELQSYDSARASFKQALSDLLKLDVDNEITLLVNELSEKENLIYEQIIASDTENQPTLPIDQAFQGLRESSATLSREFERQVDEKFRQLRENSELLEKWLLLKGAILLTISFVFILTLFVLVSRSIRQLQTAIRRLESADLSEPIIVTGPSDLVNLGHRLEWLRTHLIELEDSKLHFIHNIGNEIEIPLQNIFETTKKIDKVSFETLNQVRPDIVKSLDNNIEKLRAVSQELILYSQIKANPEMKLKEFVNLKEMIEAILEGFEPGLQKKSIKLNKSLHSIEVLGNQQQLLSICEQLIANAISFSPEEGEISISLRTVGNHIELEFEDEGSGIHPDERIHIFEPFYRSESKHDGESNQSPGLGLALVKEYVANHRGTIIITDSKDHKDGTRIIVQIPHEVV